MPKPQTTAVLVLTGINDLSVGVSTQGTRAAPGSRIVSWKLQWGDLITSNGVNAPPLTLNHPYSTYGTYTAIFTVIDNKGRTASASLMMIIPYVPAPPGGCITLSNSGPITVTSNGQVIQNLNIISATTAINVGSFTDVQIKNCRIHYGSGQGINFGGAHRLNIYNVEIIHDGSPASGPNSGEWNGINGEPSTDVRIDRVKGTDCSTLIYLNNGHTRPWLSNIEGYNMRGPFPRGQLVQFGAGTVDGILEDFYNLNNPAIAWTEDNINMYQCFNFIVRRGIVDGNNSNSGVGFIGEQEFGGNGGLWEDLEAVRQGNGCFSAYLVGHGQTFRRCNARDNICGDQGRGAPLSGALMYGVGPGSTGINLFDCEYWNPCNPGNIIWDTASIVSYDVTNVNFTHRTPLSLDMGFC